jgi:glycosyltransferase involved in cell wall biosynthesis
MNHSISFVSVIVPALNAQATMPRVLEALRASDFPRHRWELIVVDDGSTDETANIAARYADTVVRLPGRNHGPAYARNRGFEVSSGEVVVFFDADVVVHRDSLRLFVEFLEKHPDVAGVFGSYDSQPTDPGLMSQYRNLLHHYVHQQNPGEVASFWAGAGALRRDVFEDAGMYDEWHFSRPQIEDIELGARISQMGQRCILAPEIQVTHLKRWTLGSLVRTDLRDRGIPWARLLAHRGALLAVGALNLKWTEKANVIVVWLALLFFLASAGWGHAWTLYAGLACISCSLLLNWKLWLFFSRTRGVFFAIRVMPAHLLYHFLNGISFILGLVLQQTFGAPLPDPTVEALHEMGLQRWPPVPSKMRKSTWTTGGD